MRRFGQYLLFSLLTSILTIILFTSSSSEGVWAEELIDNPLRRAKLSEMNIVPPKPILNVDIYNGIEDYEVGQLPQERIIRKLIHHTFFPDAHIGFTSIGNCISIGIVPALSFNITDTFTIEAGAGAGYKDLSTEMWVPEGEKDNDGNKTLKPLSGKTILEHHRLLRAMLHKAVYWQVIVSNPAERVQPPKAKKPKRKYYDDDQCKILLENLEQLDE